MKTELKNADVWEKQWDSTTIDFNELVPLIQQNAILHGLCLAAKNSKTGLYNNGRADEGRLSERIIMQLHDQLRATLRVRKGE